jgi:hypothetical protein
MTAQEKFVRENADRKEREATFVREHQAKAKTWAPLGGIPFGIAGPAGPVQLNRATRRAATAAD